MSNTNSTTHDIIDGAVTKHQCEPLEAHLQTQEDFAKRMEAERIAKLAMIREADLRNLGVNTSGMDLGRMVPQDRMARWGGPSCNCRACIRVTKSKRWKARWPR